MAEVWGIRFEPSRLFKTLAVILLDLSNPDLLKHCSPAEMLAKIGVPAPIETN